MTLTAVQRAVLDRIASGESPDYQTIFGGKKFESYADHPRVAVPIPGRPGLFSTAAGRYQLLAPTWDMQRKRLGLADFSPDNQDAAAWDLANRTYKQRTGRDLASDQGKGQVDWNSLANQWTSLRSKPEPAAQQIKPSAAYPVLQNPPELQNLLHPERAGAPSNALALPASLNPAPAANPGLALAILKTAAPQHDFVPVDYNPWKLQPMLQPVDHDPFAEEQQQ